MKRIPQIGSRLKCWGDPPLNFHTAAKLTEWDCLILPLIYLIGEETLPSQPPGRKDRNKDNWEFEWIALFLLLSGRLNENAVNIKLWNKTCFKSQHLSCLGSYKTACSKACHLSGGSRRHAFSVQLQNYILPEIWMTLAFFKTIKSVLFLRHWIWEQYVPLDDFFPQHFVCLYILVLIYLLYIIVFL